MLNNLPPTTPPHLDTDKKIIKVSQLCYQARMLLENNFSAVWVEGEISNLAQPSSGHIYFSLKDERAQVRCAMFRGRNQAINFTLENGKKVIALAEVSIYEPRGDFQLIVQRLELAGLGALHEKFLQLKNKLANEGLFENKFKKAIPKFASAIGVITSPTGAAIRDVLTILQRRFAAIPVIIYPTLVQGNEATPKIVDAINVANRRKECDLLILTRGGGSLEDLWCFNEETVARAIFASTIPIISAVGHEIDFTIADFVADQRAPTPSAAAELATPDGKELAAKLSQLHKHLINFISSRLKQNELLLKNLIGRLHHPLYYLQQYAQKIDHLEHRLKLAVTQQLKNLMVRLQTVHAALEMINPYATLQRGYAIIIKDNKVIQSIQNLAGNDHVEIKLSDGMANATINDIKKITPKKKNIEKHCFE